MISFSNNKTKAQLDELKTASGLVVDRVYFVAGVGTFIATAVDNYTRYDYDVEAVSGNITGWVNDQNFAHKAPGDFGTIFINSGTDGDLVSSEYSIGIIGSEGFGDETELAVESAVKDYVDTAINNVTSDAITEISYSNESAQLSAVIGGTNTAITPAISGLVRGFSYASNVVTLTTTKADGTTEDRVINIPAEQLLSGVAYVQIPSDFATTGVVATFKTGDTPTLTSSDITPNGAKFGIVFRFATQTIDSQNFTAAYTFVPVEDLVKDYNTTQFTISEGKLTLLDSVISGKIDKVFNETGEVPQFKADGNIESTGKVVGAETASALSGAHANTLATEMAVSGFIFDCLSFK